MVFCNLNMMIHYRVRSGVTILILVDGFLQSLDGLNTQKFNGCHNPYFSRWFSAMQT